MRTSVIGLLLAAALAPAAGAQTVGGNYSVTGTNPNGQAYSGSAHITPSGSACRITWQTGGTSSAGVCMLANKAFAASYILQGKQGLVVYELQGNGTLKGWWTIVDTEGVGTETLVPR
jgi:hypothetical protein